MRKKARLSLSLSLFSSSSNSSTSQSETFKLFMSCCVVARAKKFQFCRPPLRGEGAFRRIPFFLRPHKRHRRLPRILAHPAAISARLICLDISSSSDSRRLSRLRIDLRIRLMRSRAPPIGNARLHRVFLTREMCTRCCRVKY